MDDFYRTIRVPTAVCEMVEEAGQGVENLTCRLLVEWLAPPAVERKREPLELINALVIAMDEDWDISEPLMIPSVAPSKFKLIQWLALYAGAPRAIWSVVPVKLTIDGDKTLAEATGQPISVGPIRSAGGRGKAIQYRMYTTLERLTHATTIDGL